jgi:hypothetical protein
VQRTRHFRKPLLVLLAAEDVSVAFELDRVGEAFSDEQRLLFAEEGVVVVELDV